tara:strand:- start:1104 stop:9533 length:8430 start_codon:yes stop_codon:yes gene_type:complete
MAPKVPGLFANPTTGFGGIGADKLQQARQDLANYQSPQIDRERISGLIEGIGGFQQKQQQRARGFDLSELSQEFGLDTDIPVTDMSGPDTQSAFSEFLSDTMAAADQGYGDMGFGASLILNDNETNMMALEQNFQRTITAPPEELGFDQNSLSRFVDADWYANMIGGTLPSISTMIAGGAAGGAITAPTVVATPLGILGGATVGSGGGVALQTLGSTTKDAYIAYRQQGKSVEEAYDLAYADAKVDSAKSGALASVATLIAPLRFARGVGVTAAPAVGAKAIAGQFAQQSLIVQPTLEVADTISSNAIAQNSYDPSRVLSQGALDAFIGSIFFDVPTTAGGILISQMNGKNVPAFEPGTQLVPATKLLTGPDPIDGEVMTPLTGPEPVAALPAPQFVIEQNEDGSWSVVDNANTDFRQNFASEEDAQFEATTRNDQIINNQIPAGFNPDSVSSRDAFLKSQIDRMEQYDANKRQANEKYTGDVRIRNTVAFFEWLRKADVMKAQWDQTYNTAAKRNTPSAIRQLADIQERIELTKIIMNPVRTTKLPNMIYQSKGGKPFRVVMDKNNRPLRPKDKQGNPKMNHVLIFDNSSKTGFRSVAISSGTLMDVSSPNPSNLLMTAPVYKRLMEARNAMLAEMRGQMQGQIEGQPAAQITDETQTPAALPYNPRFGEDQPGVTERGNERAEQPGTSRPDPNAPPDVIPLPDETQTEAETGRDPVETDMNELIRQRLGLSPAVIKDDEVTAASPDSVIDEAEAEAEIEYTIKTRRMRTPEGMVDEVQPPITSVADGGNIMYTMRLQMVGSSNYAWFLVDENGGEVARSGSAKTPGIPELPIGYTKDEAIAYMKNMLRERNEDPKFTRSRDAGQRGGATAFGEGVEAMLEAVPEQDRSNVRKVLMMFQQALGKALDTVDVVDMATWLQNQDVVADDGMFVAAYLNNWVKQQSGGIQKGAIAISQGLSSPDAVRALAHELTHFTVKVKNISKDMMVEFYNSVPENDSIRQVIDSDPFYSQQSVEVRAEEVLAETLAQMLTNRYRGRLHQESTFKYMLRQIVRVVREAFEGITGRDTVDTFFANLAKQYGADTQATNPFMDKRDPVFGRIVPVNRGNIAAQERFGVEEVLPGGNYVDLDQDGADVTGKVYDNVNIAISPEGRPSMTTSDVEVSFTPPEQTKNREGRAINLVNPNKSTKKRQKWEWLDRDNATDPIHTIVSVTSTNNLSSENGGATKIKTPSGPHEYALMVDMDGPTKLSTFPDAPDEPRLRPVMYAQKVERGPVVGRIRMKGRDGGKEHPVYEYIRLVDEEAPKFARKTGDDGSTLPPEASKTMEDIQKNIPEHKRVARATQMGTQQTAVDGKRFIDKDLSAKGRGWIGKRSVKEIWEQAIANTPGGKEKLEMMKRSGIDMMPKAEEFWNRSFNREDRARYWYEISSEMFRATFPDATDAQLEQFIDLVGATSVQANPTDNILRAIAVFSEYLQGMPIVTDLTDAEGVRKALSPEMLGGPKTRSFSGTMLYLLGKRAEVPLSTNDRQVATVFGVDGEVIANDYLLYELISNFYIGMRDEMNANMPPNAEPYETWQIQALGWVEERAEKNAAKNKFEEYDDYAMVIQNKVMPRLEAAGISVPNGQLTQTILKDTRIPFALRDTMAKFTGSSIATVETVSKLNPVGDRFATLVRKGRGLKGTVGMMKEADTIVKQSMASVAKRKAYKPNALDKLASAILGKKTDLRRIDTNGFGTFEGEENPNIRIPLQGMDASQRQIFLAILGRGLRQAAMAASVFKPADINQPPRPNHMRTFSVFVQTTDRTVQEQLRPESGKLSSVLGRPINVDKRPNGVVFDINVGGFDPITDVSIVSAAVRKIGLDKKGTILLLPRDYLNEYGFDYIEMDRAVDDDMQIGYNQIVENFIEEATNGAVQEAQGIDSRISEGGVRAYLRGDDKAEISNERLPSPVSKRVERIRTRLRERVDNLRGAEADIATVASVLEDAEAGWLARHGEKLEKLIANADPDDVPKFARSSLIPEADQTSDTDSITEEEFALFSRYLNMPESDAKTRMLEWMSRNWFTGVFTSSAQRIIGMGRGTKAAYKLANMFDRDKYGRTGRNETGIIGQDVHDEISERIAKFSTQFTEQVLKGLSPKQANAMAEILRGKFRNPQTGAIQIPRSLGISADKARQMRKLMDDLYQEMVDAYQSRGLTAPEKLPMYFPQRYSIDRKIHGVEGRDALVAFFTKVFEGNKDPRAKAEMVVQKIEDEGYQPTWGFDLAATLNQKAYNITPQELRRIIRIPSYATFRVNVGGQTVNMTLADFLDNDTVSVTQNYIASTVRRTTFIRRFGAKGEDIQAIAGANGEIDKELINRGERPLTSSERESIFYAIRANMGILPRKSFFGATSGTGAYSFQNGMKLFGNMAFLSLSAIQSIAEPALIFSRTGMMGGLAGVQQLAKSTFLTPVAMTRGLGAAATSKGRRYAAFKEAYSMSDTDMKVFARDLGIIFESFQYALQNSAEEGAHFKYEKWNNIFFRANLLQPLTEAQQAAALAAAVRVLPTWRKKALQGSNMHKRWLTEVGLTEQDLAMFDPKDAMASANPKVRAALRQIVNETIMNPDPGRKPAWMSDPRFALVAHIKSWIFTFNNTVLQRTAREVTKGNVMPLIYLAGFGALNAVMYEMKEWLRYGEEGNPYLNRIGLEKDNPYRFLFLALERGGLFGPAQFAVDTVLGTRVGTGGSDIAGALVPSYNLANRALNGVAYIIDAPFSENPDKKFRRGVDELSRLVPGLNAAGQFRSDFVTQITGVEPGRRKRGSGISRGGSGGSVSRGVSR